MRTKADLSVGDSVTWTSQAGGTSKTKTGTVMQVVLPGRLPDRQAFPELYRHSGVGMARSETSYVVQVGRKVYWPRTSALQADAIRNETLSRIAELERELDFYKERERDIAKVLDVPDGGQFRADWPGAVQRLKSQAVEEGIKAGRAESQARIAQLEKGCAQQNEEICQTLGKVLGYPWFKDDQKNFPGATEAEGVCVGEHVAETIAAEAAARITALERELARKAGELFDEMGQDKA